MHRENIPKSVASNLDQLLSFFPKVSIDTRTKMCSSREPICLKIKKTLFVYVAESGHFELFGAPILMFLPSLGQIPTRENRIFCQMAKFCIEAPLPRSNADGNVGIIQFKGE